MQTIFSIVNNFVTNLHTHTHTHTHTHKTSDYVLKEIKF